MKLVGQLTENIVKLPIVLIRPMLSSPQNGCKLLKAPVFPKLKGSPTLAGRRSVANYVGLMGTEIAKLAKLAIRCPKNQIPTFYDHGLGYPLNV